MTSSLVSLSPALSTRITEQERALCSHKHVIRRNRNAHDTLTVTVLPPNNHNNPLRRRRHILTKPSGGSDIDQRKDPFESTWAPRLTRLSLDRAVTRRSRAMMERAGCPLCVCPALPLLSILPLHPPSPSSLSILPLLLRCTALLFVRPPISLDGSGGQDRTLRPPPGWGSVGVGG